MGDIEGKIGSWMGIGGDIRGIEGDIVGDIERENREHRSGHGGR